MIYECLHVVENKLLTFVVDWCGMRKDPKVGGFSGGTCKVTQNPPRHPPRYISPSEACWRIFGFPIHGRQPAIERLYFHLPGEHPVYFNDHDEIDNILSRPIVSESMEIICYNALINLYE
ncbi:hypothetical protein Lal_00008558 [Lupinus albus]|nr:hypothetical protein Lal_00008558 [Lupinus albus]